MILLPARAHDLCVRAFTRNGVPGDEASNIADVLVAAEMWGKPTHGLSRVPGLLERRQLKTPGTIQVLSQGPCHVHIDAAGHFGYVALRVALDEAMGRAAKVGVCVAGVRDSDHCGVAGYYAWLAAHKGFIAGLTCDCFPRTAPFGATSPVFGTNPIAIGIPTEGEPLVLDFSVAAMTNGLMGSLQRDGQCLPEGVAFDSTGRPTTDPAEALAGAVKAFGGHKGSGLAIVAQALCTALVGATALPAQATDYGYFVLVMKPDLFVTMPDFRRILRELLGAVKAARPEAGAKEVLLPGERSRRSKQKALEHGLDVAEPVAKRLLELADGA